MTDRRSITVMVSAGEASGDAHAAQVIKALQQNDIPVQCFGMGADCLHQAGADLIVDCRDLAVIGIVDVLINYPRFLRRLAQLRACLRQRRPDVLLLVDYPDFNLNLAETARTLGIPVLFYISPKVWAWRAGRIRRIARLVDHMAVLFPFEVEIYERAGVPVSYVGNPVVAEAVSDLSTSEARQDLGLDTEQAVVSLLPGSRTGEILRNLPAMLATARELSRHLPECRFLLPVAPTLERSFIEQQLGSDAPSTLTIVDGRSLDVMRAGDVALVASGTATLETALIGTPMVVMYIVNRLNYAIMKRLIRIRDVSLVNIVAGQRIVPEYIQDAAQPEAMAKDLLSLMQDKARRERMLANLQTLKATLGDSGASARVAELLLRLAGHTHSAQPAA